MSNEEGFSKPLIELGIEIAWNGQPVASITYHIKDMLEAGIDPFEFIQGYKDAKTDNGFNGVHKDYIAGFKFGVTGIVDIKK